MFVVYCQILTPVESYHTCSNATLLVLNMSICKLLVRLLIRASHVYYVQLQHTFTESGKSRYGSLGVYHTTGTLFPAFLSF